MAVGLAITSEVGKYNGKMTPFVVLSCMIVAIGGVIFGYILEFQVLLPKLLYSLKKKSLVSFFSYAMLATN